MVNEIILRPKIGSTYRYAKAFLSVLSESQKAHLIKEINTLTSTLHELWTNLHYKKLKLPDQKDIISLWAKQFDLPFFNSFIQLIFENNKHKSIIEILNCAKEIYYDQNDIVTLTITTAKKLTPQEKSSLIENFKRAYPSQKNKEIIMTYHVHSKILGGIIFELDGKIKDLSLLSHLQDMQSHLLEPL